MIELLGLKRAIILAALFAVNLVVAAAFFLLLMPMKDEADQNLTTIKSQIFQLQTDIQNIKMELQQIKETMPKYDALAGKGFFLDQDRFYISRTLEEVKSRSQLAGFSFAIDDIKEIKSADAAAAKRRLVASRIKIDRVISLLDVGFFDFMNVIESTFPAHVRIQSFQIRKQGSINEDALRRIASGDSSNLIQANLDMDWLTMTEIPSPTEGGPK